MFTGLITAVGRVTARDDSHETRFRIACDWHLEALPLGASIACSGCCLTVVEAGQQDGDLAAWFDVEVSAESLDKTTLARWGVGTAVNLEQALRLGDHLGGHQVLGHVDAVGRIDAIEPVGDSHRVWFIAPEALRPLIASKGSIAIDGVSLTVNDVEAERFNVNIIPHTWQVTTLGNWRTGDAVNLEVDPLARYVAQFLRNTNLKQLLAEG